MEEELSRGYPQVGSGATKGVLSKGYMLACPDQVLHQSHVSITAIPQKHGGKHGGNFRTVYTASDDRISPPEA